MGNLVCGGALLKCSFGTAPSSYNVLPDKKVMTSMAIGNISDNVPMLNVMPFAMCTSPANPTVLAAQGAPQPCMPVISAPWVPGCPTVLIGGKPAVNKDCKLMCNWAGVIEVSYEGQATIKVP